VKARRIVAGLALVVGAAACGGDTSAPLSPAGPSYDGGGHTLGSGGGTPGTTTTQGDTTQRGGGHTLGSGG
jgi:hypothetical protein